jgi:hypothetical protein
LSLGLIPKYKELLKKNDNVLKKKKKEEEREREKE